MEARSVEANEVKLDDRLTCISTRLKEVNKEIEEVEWNCDALELGPDKLQTLYLEREHLQYLLHKGDFYVPNF